MTIVAIVFVLSIFGGLSMGTVLLPEMDAPQMSMSIKMPKDSTFNDTKDMTDTVFQRLLEIEEIETIGAFKSDSINSLGGGADGGDSISLYLLLHEDKDISNEEIKREIIERTNDLDCTITVTANTMDTSALVGSGLEVVIKVEK